MDNSKYSKAGKATENQVTSKPIDVTLALQREFPDGFELVLTDSTGLQCGLESVLNSTHDIDRVQTPPLDELQVMGMTGEIWEGIKATGLLDQEAFDENFQEDHLAAIVEKYGRQQGQYLKLGVHQANGPTHIVFPRDMPDDAIIIWIHNDNGEGTFRYQNDDGEEMTIQVMGHYSDVKRKRALVDQSPLSNIDSEVKKSLDKVPKPAKKATGDKTPKGYLPMARREFTALTGLKIRRDIIIHIQDPGSPRAPFPGPGPIFDEQHPVNRRIDRSAVKLKNGDNQFHRFKVILRDTKGEFWLLQWGHVDKIDWETDKGGWLKRGNKWRPQALRRAFNARIRKTRIKWKRKEVNVVRRFPPFKADTPWTSLTPKNREQLSSLLPSREIESSVGTKWRKMQKQKRANGGQDPAEWGPLPEEGEEAEGDEEDEEEQEEDHVPPSKRRHRHAARSIVEDEEDGGKAPAPTSTPDPTSHQHLASPAECEFAEFISGLENAEGGGRDDGLDWEGVDDLDEGDDAGLDEDENVEVGELDLTSSRKRKRDNEDSDGNLI